MRRYYYVLNNGRIKRKDNTILFETDQESKFIPINDIDAIFCLGEVDFNTKALNYLAQNNITVHLFNYYGYYTGSFYPREYLPSGFLLVKQVEKYINQCERLKIAKELVETATFNILKNVKYYANRKENLDGVVNKIMDERSKIASIQNIESIMGLEGRVRDLYYSAIPIIIDEKFEFKKREKNPPNNAMNALISFGNSLMYATVLGELYHTQLNPTISYLHEPGERRFSLSLDISEVFKPLIVDRIIFKLINEGMIKKEHFAEELNCCYLNDAGRRIFLKEYNEKLNTTINHRNLNRSVSYRMLVRLECYGLVKHIADDKQYKGFKAWW